MAAFPAAFFIACGQPNQERSSTPLLTVLLLLTREHQEEGDGASNEGTGPLGCGHLRGLFILSALQTQKRTAFGALKRRSSPPLVVAEATISCSPAATVEAIIGVSTLTT